MILLGPWTAPAAVAYWDTRPISVADLLRPDPGAAEVEVVEHRHPDTDWARLAARGRKAGA